MMRGWFAVATLAGAVFLGCGGTEAVADPETPGSAESALVTCSATCPNGSTLTCTGFSCSAQNNSHVECDGSYQYCPTAPSNCQWFTATSYASSDDACNEARQQGAAYCAAYGGVKSYGPMCLTTPDDNPYVAANYICCNF